MKKILFVLCLIASLIILESCDSTVPEGYSRVVHSHEEVSNYLENFLGNDNFTLSESNNLYVDEYSRKYYVWIVETNGLQFEITSKEKFVYDGFAGEFGHLYYSIETNYSQEALKKICMSSEFDSTHILVDREYFLTFMDTGYVRVIVDKFEDIDSLYEVANNMKMLLEEVFPLAQAIFIFEETGTGLINNTIGYVTEFNADDHQKIVNYFNSTK